MTEKITKYTLWALMAGCVVVMVLFAAVGYDTPYEENPDFADPMFTDLLLGWTSFLVIAAIGVTVWGVFHGLLTKGTGTQKETGLVAHTNALAWGICAASVVLGIIVGMINKGEVMLINGKDFNVGGEDAGDIIATDLCIVSIAILVVVTLVATIWSMIPSKK